MFGNNAGDNIYDYLKLMNDLKVRTNRNIEVVTGAIVLDDLAGLLVISSVSSLFLGELISTPKMIAGIALFAITMFFVAYPESKLISLVLDITRTASSDSESPNKIFCNDFGLYKIVERCFFRDIFRIDGHAR